MFFMHFPGIVQFANLHCDIDAIADYEYQQLDLFCGLLRLLSARELRSKSGYRHYDCVQCRTRANSCVQ